MVPANMGEYKIHGIFEVIVCYTKINTSIVEN
jgi:hypothetical protein